MVGAGLSHMRTEQMTKHTDRVAAFQASGLHLGTPQGMSPDALTVLWASSLTSPGWDQTAVFLSKALRRSQMRSPGWEALVQGSQSCKHSAVVAAATAQRRLLQASSCPRPSPASPQPVLPTMPRDTGCYHFLQMS